MKISNVVSLRSYVVSYKIVKQSSNVLSGSKSQVNPPTTGSSSVMKRRKTPFETSTEMPRFNGGSTLCVTYFGGVMTIRHERTAPVPRLRSRPSGILPDLQSSPGGLASTSYRRTSQAMRREYLLEKDVHLSHQNTCRAPPFNIKHYKILCHV